MSGMLERPTGFEQLGALSPQGPLRTVVALILVGGVLVLAGGAYGPIEKRFAGRSRVRTEPAGAR